MARNGKKKRGGGRPPLPPEVRRGAIVYTRLTPEERRHLDRFARDPRWRSRSDILRQAFLEWVARQGTESRDDG